MWRRDGLLYICGKNVDMYFGNDALSVFMVIIGGLYECMDSLVECIGKWKSFLRKISILLCQRSVE